MALTRKSAPGFKFATVGALLLTGLLGLASAVARSLARPQPATTLDCGTVKSAILGRDVNVCVDLPADYSSSAARRYPAGVAAHLPWIFRSWYATLISRPSHATRSFPRSLQRW